MHSTEAFLILSLCLLSGLVAANVALRDDQCTNSGQVGGGNLCPPPRPSSVVSNVLYVVVSPGYDNEMHIGYTLLQNAVSAYNGSQVKKVELVKSVKTTGSLNRYDQIWVADLSDQEDLSPSQRQWYQTIAEWYNDRHPNVDIICDGRWISSLWSQSHGATEQIFGYPVNTGRPNQKLVTNYFENLRRRNGGLVLLTDHAPTYTSGINSINQLIGINGFEGFFDSYPWLLETDVGSHLAFCPEHATHHAYNGKEYLWDDSSTSHAPTNVQPNGRILYPVGWHGAEGTGEPGISTTIRGTVGFLVELANPTCDSEYLFGSLIQFVGNIVGDLPGVGPYQNSFLEGSTLLSDGNTATTTFVYSTSTLGVGIHVITLRVGDSQGLIAEAHVRIHVYNELMQCGDGSTEAHPFGAVVSLFNTFIIGDFSCKYSDTAGRLAAGGNIDIQGYGVGCKVFAQPNQYCGAASCEDVEASGWKYNLVAGNNLKYASGGVDNGAAAYAGEYNGANVNVDCGVEQAQPIDFDAEEQYLLTLSQNIKNQVSTGTIISRYGGLTLNASGAAIEVFHLSSAQLGSANGITLVNAAAGATVLVNVAGGIVQARSFQFNGFNPSKTLWNFHEATLLTPQYLSWKGSILAPLANVVESQGNIDGQVIAKKWTPFSWGGCMQQHEVPFTGCVPAPSK